MALSSIKSTLVNNGKNLLGWRTKRKIVVFAIDDYGNVRIDSPEARLRLTKAGIKVQNRFDAYDALETHEDLELLFETLRSAKDQHGRPAVFTPYAVPCNIDFEKIRAEDYAKYFYELLPQTFQKKAEADPQSYANTWELWKQGVAEGLLEPQFHGREHLNVSIFEERLLQKNEELLTQLKNRSFTHLSASDKQPVSSLAAFDFWDFEENDRFEDIIIDGLNRFEEVFGYRAQNFTPPVYSAHPVLYEILHRNGVRFVDNALIAHQHQGNGKYKKKMNYTGKQEKGLRLMVRNAVFEPTSDSNIDWVSYTMKQIEAAFRWNRPVIISSHRVNFCGHIDPENREAGINALQGLLNKITRRWPDVEFMSASELGTLILSK